VAPDPKPCSSAWVATGRPGISLFSSPFCFFFFVSSPQRRSLFPFPSVDLFSAFFGRRDPELYPRRLCVFFSFAIVDGNLCLFCLRPLFPFFASRNWFDLVVFVGRAIRDPAFFDVRDDLPPFFFWPLFIFLRVAISFFPDLPSPIGFLQTHAGGFLAFSVCPDVIKSCSLSIFPWAVFPLT